MGSRNVNRSFGIEELIRNRGYLLEHHSVETDDGYILSLHRMKNRAVSTKSTPILLIHGLGSCFTAWVDVNDDLGYFLADNGFDVWMGSCRGTTFSNRHVALDCIKDARIYWDFSWHELGYYDLPAFIDYILKLNNVEKLIYVGHSQGTTSFLAGFSSRPEYNAKICLSIFLAPVAFFSDSTRFRLKGLALYVNSFNFLYGPRVPTMLCSLLRTIVRVGSSNSFLRKYFLFGKLSFLSGGKMEGFDFQIFLQNSPNSFSIKQMIHYTQIAKANRFIKYDHGPAKNKELYAKETPPDYDLSKITAPIALFWGGCDAFCSDNNAQHLAELLKNVIHTQKIEGDYRHLDYLHANDNHATLFKDILQLFEKVELK